MFAFQTDYKQIEKTFDGIAKKAMPKAASGYLNGIAFGAQKELKAQISKAFKGHVKFTERAFAVEKAKPSERGDMSSAVKVLPIQAEYLKYQMEGGTRRGGDVGAWKKDVPVDAKQRNAAGNIKWSYVRRISKQAKEERRKRAQLRAQREAARMTGQDTSAYAWVNNSRKPGIFFGEINGIKGYWGRPRRSKKARRRRRGVVSVKHTTPIHLLVFVAASAKYKPRFDYEGSIDAAMNQYATSAAFAHEMNRALARQK